MAVPFFWRCEGTTFSGTDDHSAGDSTPTANNSPSISSAQAFAGTNSILLDDNFEGYIFDSASIVDADAEYSFAFSFYMVAWNTVELLQIVDASETANHVIVETTGTAGTGNVSMEIEQDLQGTTTVATTGANLTTGNWYSVVGRIDPVNLDARIEVYNSSGTEIGTAGENLAVNTDHFPPESLIDTIWIGLGFDQNHHIDNVFFGDAYDEPLENNLDITSYTNYDAGGGVTGTGALTIPFATAAGTGAVTNPPDVYDTGEGVALTLPSQTVSGTGLVPQSVTGTGALTLLLPAAAGTGTSVLVQNVTGTGVLTIPLLGAAGTGTSGSLNITGTGALTLPLISVFSDSGDEVIERRRRFRKRRHMARVFKNSF